MTGLTAASAAERLAVLLAAGIPPSAAWEFTTAEPARDPAVAMRERGWTELASAWTIASESGAPLAPALRTIAVGLRDGEQTARDTAAALAGPAATARLVLALPVVGVLFGLALGFDTVHTLFATPLGWACLAVGAALVVVAFAWNRRLVARARGAGPAPGLGCELLAVALGGGAPPSAAVATVEHVAAEHGLAIELGSAAEVLELSARSGAPASELLRSAADDARREARANAQAAAGRLGVLLMLPLGVCVLPAFFAVGVVPLLATVVGATFGE